MEHRSVRKRERESKKQAKREQKTQRRLERKQQHQYPHRRGVTRINFAAHGTRCRGRSVMATSEERKKQLLRAGEESQIATTWMADHVDDYMQSQPNAKVMGKYLDH